MILRVKKLITEAKLPDYANPGDAGLNLYSREDVTINPSEWKIIATGIAMAIPSGYVGLIWDRSSIPAKFGLKTMGGVIDSGYRGEIKIIMHNLSTQQFVVEKGMKIAQMLVQAVEQREIMEVSELDATARGEKGFGSSGMK